MNWIARLVVAFLCLHLSMSSAFSQAVVLPYGAPPSPLPLSVTKTTQSSSDTNVLVVGNVLFFEATLSQTGSATGGWLWIVDSASVLADGTYTGTATPGNCIPVPPIMSPDTKSGATMANLLGVPQVQNGVFVAFSTGADCNHLVKSPAYISVQYSVQP